MRLIIADLVGKIVSRRADAIRKKTPERLADGYRFIAERFYFEREAENYFLGLALKVIDLPKGGELRFRIAWPV